MRPLPAVAVVALLIMSTLALLSGVGHAQGLPTPVIHPHPAASVVVTPVASDGIEPNPPVFQSGSANGQIFFSSYDPSGDTTALVQINDLNASRDGLHNPVANWTAHYTTTNPYNESYFWNNFYQIPFTLVYGGEWNITIRGALGGFNSVNFTVATYAVNLIPTQPMWLAGHVGTVLFNVNSTANNSPFTSVTSLSVTGVYYSAPAGRWLLLPGMPHSIAPAAWGMFNVTVPLNASDAVTLEIWANVSSSNAKVSESMFTAIPVGAMELSLVAIASCPQPSCVSSIFSDGAPVYVLIQASILRMGVSTPASNLAAKVQFEKGTALVTPPGNPPSTLTTNATGQASLLFIASAQVFSTTGTNSVVVTLSDPLNSNATPIVAIRSFFVTPQGAGNAILSVTVDRLQYYSGDTVTATWQLGGLNASQSSTGWTVDAWQVWGVTTETLIAQGPIHSTSSQGTFQFTAPPGFGGEVRVTVTAHNASTFLSGDQLTYVTAPTILLNAGTGFYLPGDTITVHISTVGTILGTAQLWESVTDSSGNLLAHGVLSNSQVQFTIPSLGTPAQVTVSVTAQDPVQGILASASVTLYEAVGYGIYAGVDTVSSYTDGSFQPGQTISIHYQVVSIGMTVLPRTLYLRVFPVSGFFGFGYGMLNIETSSSSGTFPYTIPSSAPRGGQEFLIEASSGSCISSCFAETQFSVNVNPHPSVLSYEVGAGSGLTVAWLLLFLIVVILVILGIWWVRRNRGRSGTFDRESVKPYTPPTSTSPPPPADAPTTPAPIAWNESAGDSESPSSSSPPLPKGPG